MLASTKCFAGSLATAAMAAIIAQPAAAGDYNGDFMVRMGVSVVMPDTGTAVALNGAPLPNATHAADIPNEVIPSATLTYFFNKNLAAELFCCFAKVDVDGKGTALSGVDLGDAWIFPPALTLQYHFDGFGGIKPYVGAGVQYIHFFSEGRSQLAGNPKIRLDDAFGFTLQAGIDIPLGEGWYLNADIKKTWIDTEASWGNGVTADVDVDPLIVSAAVGYRFNLSDIFGRRSAYEPMK